MKLTKPTMNILKNFASINPSIYLRKGNVIATKSIDNNIYAEATIDDVIDADIGVYDVSEFLSIVGLFSADDVEIISNTTDMQVKIKDKRSAVSYTVVDPSVILFPDPAKYAKLPTADIQFELKEADLERLIKAASALGLPMINICNDGDKIVVKANDPKDPSANDYVLELADYDGPNTFNYALKVEALKLIKSDYHVHTFSNKAIKFEGDAVSYIIAVESVSTFS